MCAASELGRGRAIIDHFGDRENVGRGEDMLAGAYACYQVYPCKDGYLSVCCVHVEFELDSALMAENGPGGLVGTKVLGRAGGESGCSAFEESPVFRRSREAGC